MPLKDQRLSDACAESAHLCPRAAELEDAEEAERRKETTPHAQLPLRTDESAVLQHEGVSASAKVEGAESERSKVEDEEIEEEAERRARQLLSMDEGKARMPHAEAPRRLTRYSFTIFMRINLAESKEKRKVVAAGSWWICNSPIKVHYRRNRSSLDSTGIAARTRTLVIRTASLRDRRTRPACDSGRPLRPQDVHLREAYGRVALRGPSRQGDVPAAHRDQGSARV